MARYSKIAALVLAGLFAAPLFQGAAYAIEILPPAGSDALARQARDADMQALRNQIQRQQFQQQQQLDRTLDRRATPRPPVLEVPRMKPGCQTQVYGNNYMRNCR